MKKTLVLSLITSALLNIPSSFSKDFANSKKVKMSGKARIELYPVKYAKTENKNCMDFNDACLLPLTKKPVVVMKNIQFQTFFHKMAGIKLFLSDKENKEIEKATRKYINKNMAFVLNGKVLSAPMVKSIIKDNSFDMTFNNQKSFEMVLEGLNRQKEE